MLIKVNVKAAISFIPVEILRFFIFVCLNYSSFYWFYERTSFGRFFYLIRPLKANYNLLPAASVRMVSGIVIWNLHNWERYRYRHKWIADIIQKKADTLLVLHEDGELPRVDPREGNNVKIVSIDSNEDSQELGWV